MCFVSGNLPTVCLGNYSEYISWGVWCKFSRNIKGLMYMLFNHSCYLFILATFQMFGGGFWLHFKWSQRSVWWHDKTQSFFGGNRWVTRKSPDWLILKETSLGCSCVLLTYFLDQDQRVHCFDIEMITWWLHYGNPAHSAFGTMGLVTKIMPQKIQCVFWFLLETDNFCNFGCHLL